MADFRTIMGLAEACKTSMITDRSAGEAAFEDLLSRHPTDGMVYLKRGEGLEFHREFRLALEDYERAVALLFIDGWIETAQSSAERLRSRPDLQGQSQERVRSIGFQEMGSIFQKLRLLLKHLDPDTGPGEMADWTTRLEREGVIPAGTANQIHSLRKFRNLAVKEDVAFDGPDAEAILASWRAVREWARTQACDLGDPV